MISEVYLEIKPAVLTCKRHSCWHPVVPAGRPPQRRRPDSPWYCCCWSTPPFLREERCPLYVGCDEASCCFSCSARLSMSILWGDGTPAGLSRASWSLLNPRMTSMLWTRPPAAMPPPFPISWKLLGDKQLSSTMLMVSSDKCIRASWRWSHKGGGGYRRKELVRGHLVGCLSPLQPSKPAYPTNKAGGHEPTSGGSTAVTKTYCQRLTSIESVLGVFL